MLIHPGPRLLTWVEIVNSSRKEISWFRSEDHVVWENLETMIFHDIPSPDILRFQPYLGGSKGGTNVLQSFALL